MSPTKARRRPVDLPGFVMVPGSDFNIGFTPSEGWAWVRLMGFANKRTRNLWPARETLAVSSGVSVRLVAGMLRKALKAGRLEVVDRRDGKSTRYRLVDPLTKGASPGQDQLGTQAIDARMDGNPQAMAAHRTIVSIPTESESLEQLESRISKQIPRPFDILPRTKAGIPTVLEKDQILKQTEKLQKDGAKSTALPWKAVVFPQEDNGVLGVPLLHDWEAQALLLAHGCQNATRAEVLAWRAQALEVTRAVRSGTTKESLLNQFGEAAMAGAGRLGWVSQGSLYGLRVERDGHAALAAVESAPVPR